MFAKRKLLGLVAACGAGILFQTGCLPFYTYTSLSAIDFCSIFNCGESTFFNFCSPNSIFTDCPGATTEDAAT